MNPENYYARLPDDMLLSMLGEAETLAGRIADRLDRDADLYEQARKLLVDAGHVHKVEEGAHTESIMCADGAYVVEQKLGVDMLLALAVGVDGLGNYQSKNWPMNASQYQYWQDALPHHIANARLARGLMSLMEMNILSGNDRDIRIMDGTHNTFITMLDGLLRCKEVYAGPAFVSSMGEFLKKNYDMVIPDIPNMIKSAFTNESVIGLSKYSSSKELVDTDFKELEFKSDDKTVLSHVLESGEYTQPFRVGRSNKERWIWKNIKIECHLPIDDVNQYELDGMLDKAIEVFRISDQQESGLYFVYYRPHDFSSCIRLEIKEQLAVDKQKLELFLRSIRFQIKSAEILEPYPQYMADKMAKSIRMSLSSLEQVMYNHPRMKEHLRMFLPNRTKS